MKHDLRVNPSPVKSFFFYKSWKKTKTFSCEHQIILLMRTRFLFLMYTRESSILLLLPHRLANPVYKSQWLCVSLFVPHSTRCRPIANVLQYFSYIRHTLERLRDFYWWHIYCRCISLVWPWWYFSFPSSSSYFSTGLSGKILMLVCLRRSFPSELTFGWQKLVIGVKPISVQPYKAYLCHGSGKQRCLEVQHIPLSLSLSLVYSSTFYTCWGI